MLQTVALDAIGMGAWLSGKSWTTVYLLVMPPTLAVLYALGAMLGSVLEQ
ncbi:hypothetical protein [Stenotrophomonas sp. ATs4]